MAKLAAWSSAKPKTTLRNVSTMVAVEWWTMGAAKAALSNTVEGPVCLAILSTGNMASDPIDNPPGGTKNAHYTNFKAVHIPLWRGFLQDYVAAGGTPPEFISTDMEDGANFYIMTNESMEALWNDSRNSEFRAEMATLGYTNYSQIIYNDRSANGSMFVWNYASAITMQRALKELYFDVAREFWPNVKCANYGEFCLPKANAAEVLYFSSYAEYSPPFTSGTHQAPDIYGLSGAAGSLYYGTTPYDLMRYEVNRLRQYVRLNPAIPVAPWVSFPWLYGGYTSQPEYHKELIRHIVMCGVEFLQYFNSGALVEDEQTFDQLLGELMARFGTHARVPQTLQLGSFAADTFVSCVKTGNTYHWRYTVKDAGVAAVAVDGNLLPVHAGERGVWYATTTSTQPSFSPVQLSALNLPGAAQAIVWPRPGLRVVDSVTGAPFPQEGAFVPRDHAVARQIASGDLLLSPPSYAVAEEGAPWLSPSSIVVWPAAGRRVVDECTGAPFPLTGLATVPTARIRRLLADGDIEDHDPLSGRSLRTIFEGVSLFGEEVDDTRSVAVSVRARGFVSIHVRVDNGAGGAPTDAPIGSWILYASADGSKFAPLSNAVVTSQMLRLAPVGNSFVQGFAVFDGFPGVALKIGYDRVSGGGGDSRATVTVTATRAAFFEME